MPPSNTSFLADMEYERWAKYHPLKARIADFELGKTKREGNIVSAFFVWIRRLIR